ncbi:hypothetical protein [Pseudomonas simiae]|uniref:hypothetical protein n=1 Tax=Pseudomonas simiae TaxID=321846 RepID=UPI0027349EE4|nr:hypothetical protein [Pseudomonas simiae]WLI01027.1 hypothetical protein PSH95_27385 [Pseudomonas simiae]
MKMPRNINIRVESTLEYIPNLPLDVWPPEAKFPIIRDKYGKTISIYSATIWDLTAWSATSSIINFNDPSQPGFKVKNCEFNGGKLREICAWWLYGYHPVGTAATLKARFGKIYKLVEACSSYGLKITELNSNLTILDKISKQLAPSSIPSVISLLHGLYENRSFLGFVILEPKQIARLSSISNDHAVRQTPYIPPRIWEYQVRRLRLFLEEFVDNSGNIENCFHHCLEVYQRFYGLDACYGNRKGLGTAFGSRMYKDHRKYLLGGKFSDVLKLYGLTTLFRNWLIDDDAELDSGGKGVTLLTSLFTMAQQIGLAYLLNFSMMRYREASELRSDCLSYVDDNQFGRLWLVSGETTKIYHDSDARWVVSPSVKIVITAMSLIAKLRMHCACQDRKVPFNLALGVNPYIINRSYEPWSKRVGVEMDMDKRPCYFSYMEVISSHPKLFDPREITIQENDFELARLVTPSINQERFSVGKIWEFTWHQLRRTGAVNMHASNMVTDEFAQQQLKHLSRNQSLYYRQGYSNVALNEDAKAEYVKAMYDVQVSGALNFLHDRYISPYGVKRKLEMLSPISERDYKSLMIAARSGELSWRDVLLGVCTHRGTCQYGGVENIIKCGGGVDNTPCAHLLVDTEKKSIMKKLESVIQSRKLSATEGSPYAQSLEAQHSAIQNMLRIIKTVEM